jgi:hypothetical protein
MPHERITVMEDATKPATAITLSKSAQKQANRQAEFTRQAASVLRCIKETSGLTGATIARRLGLAIDAQNGARTVREYVRHLRANGEPISIGADGLGYVHLDSVTEEHERAALVIAHRERTRSYLLDHARLLKQAGRMTAVEVAQFAMFDLLVPQDKDAPDAPRPVDMADIARLPIPRRAGLLALLQTLLDGLANDPVAFEAERAVLADKYGGIFLTKANAAKLVQIKRPFEEVNLN